MSVVEAEKRMNRASIDSEVFELPHNSFVLEPDYAGDMARRLRLTSQPPLLVFISLQIHRVRVIFLPIHLQQLKGQLLLFQVVFAAPAFWQRH